MPIADALKITYKLAKAIYDQAQLAKANKTQWQRLSERLDAVEQTLAGLETYPQNKRFEKNLQRLNKRLQQSIDLLQSYTDDNTIMRFVKAGGLKNKFTRLNAELSQAISDLQLGINVEQLFNRAQDEADWRQDLDNFRDAIKQLEQANRARHDSLRRRNDSVRHAQRHMHEQLQQLTVMLKTPARGAPDHLIRKVGTDDFDRAEKLGSGSFGDVYRGALDGSPVAVKQFREDLAHDARQEFIRETQVMAKLSSPRVVQLFAVCEDEKSSYAIIMEYMPQGDLYALLHNGQALEWNIRYQIAQDVGYGLKHLHDANIIHRDLKSRNVLLDSNLRAKLSDFGLSKVKTQSRTSVTATQGTAGAGTMAWMAPELFKRRARHTPKADVYSLGMVFWELAARQTPFADASNPALIGQWVTQGETEDIPENCPAKFARVIQSCWTYEPAQRPDTKQVMRALRKAIPPAPTAPLPAVAAPQVAQAPLTPPRRPQAKVSPPPRKLVSPELPTPATAPAPEKAPKSRRKSQRDKAPPPRYRQLPPEKGPDYGKGSPRLFRADEEKSPDNRRYAKDVSQLLLHVVRGEQDEAEAMLKAKPLLAQLSGDITDLSDRKFTNITAFQYAYWAVDVFMCEMIVGLRRVKQGDSYAYEQKPAPYLSEAAAAAQIAAWECHTDANKHGKNFSFNRLLTAYDDLEKHWDNWGWGKIEQHWCTVIGEAQRKLPAHVIQEYTTPERAFDPLPTFAADVKRVAAHEGQAGWPSKVATLSVYCGKSGEKWAVLRGYHRTAARRTEGPMRHSPGFHRSDRSAAVNLSVERSLQLSQLRQQLTAAPAQTTLSSRQYTPGNG